MRNEIEFAAYVAICLFNAEGFVWWVRMWKRDLDPPRALYFGLAAQFGILVASVVLTISQGMFTFDRIHVVAIGRWLRPTLAGATLFVGIVHRWWRR